jgi:hypothetical protein
VANATCTIIDERIRELPGLGSSDAEALDLTGGTAMVDRTRRAVNKSAYVRSILQRNPEAKRKSVEEAWLAAGHEGVIFSALVNYVRTSLGLKGGSRASGSDRTAETASPSKRTGMKRGRPPKGDKNGAVDGAARVREQRSGGRPGVLAEIEADIDRLIFRLIAVGGLEAIEEEPRKVRRRLILGQGG